jgi:hypothetical protein
VGQVRAAFLSPDDLPSRKLLPRHPEFDYHTLVSFIVDKEMAIEEKAASSSMCARATVLLPRVLGVEGRSPQEQCFCHRTMPWL